MLCAVLRGLVDIYDLCWHLKSSWFLQAVLSKKYMWISMVCAATWSYVNVHRPHSHHRPCVIIQIHVDVYCRIFHCTVKSNTMLIKSTLDQEVESTTSWSELAIESTEEPGRYIERYISRSRERLRVSQSFQFWTWLERCSLSGFLTKNVGCFLASVS